MDKQELNDWGQRLDAGLTGDPALELAEQLRNKHFIDAQPPVEFRKRLKAKLISTENIKPAGIRSRLRIAAASLFTVLVVASILVLQQTRPVSAAEILNRANTNFTAQAHTGGILYDQFSLSVDVYSFDTKLYKLKFDAVGEVWQSTEGDQFRYQLTDDDGGFLYFVQRNGGQIWRSVHDQPVGAAPIEQVYLLTPEQVQPTLLGQEDSSRQYIPPVFGDLIYWIELDRWLAAQSQSCGDLFCLLGLGDSSDWSCEKDRCILSIPQPGAVEVNLEARVTGMEQLADGRKVYVMEFRTDHDDALIRSLKFDVEDYTLVEIVAFTYNTEIARMTFQERQILPASQTLSFSALPDGLQQVTWEEDTSPPRPTLAQTPLFHPPPGSSAVFGVPSLIYSTPKEGSTLSGQVEFVLFIEYSSVKADGDLIVHLCASSYDRDPDFSLTNNCAGLPETQTRIRKYKHTYRVEFTVDIDEDWPEIVSIMLETRYDDSDESLVMYVAAGQEYYWYVDP